MGIKGKILVIFIVLLIFAISIIAISNTHKKEEEKIKLELIAQPPDFEIEEGQNITIKVKALKNGIPIETKIEWDVKSNGNTGQLIMPFPSETNESGYLTVKYIAPSDVNEMVHKVKIIAKFIYEGQEAKALINGSICPKLYETKIIISCDKKKMIAGETCHFKASIAYYDRIWIPLRNATIQWQFFINGTKIREENTRSDENGFCLLPFFYSNAEKNLSIYAVAKYKTNLNGSMDFNGSESNVVKIKIIPEKPGDFPVVLIHGWVGSSSQTLINFTWYNLTQKLLQHGFKLLDFDVVKPGIQWLEYEPGWENHHIPWIAAKVSQEIRKALVLNGYPPNQTIDVVAHSMGGLIARFMAEHYMADVDYWNDSWIRGSEGTPWYGDGDGDVVIGPEQIDDLIAVGTPCHGVPPNINESLLQIINYAKFPWWIGQVPDMIYGSPFLKAMGYKSSPLVDYYGVGGDIGWIFGGVPKDFDGDGIPHYSDGLCPTESPYLEGRPLYILTGKAWPYGKEDHMSLIGINDKVHEYILKHLID
ncbi:MAG: hypothetical protein J7K95_01965 [Thermoplasmata archaeon]|nr:hypothetical protein [Thermoplasmata archaeon]